MKTLLRGAILLLIEAQAAHGQPAVYEPFGSWVDPRVAVEQRWNAELANRVDRLEVKADARPVLPGLRPKSVEILQDALLRKHHKLLGNDPAKARELLLRRYHNNLPQLRGITAEAIFVEQNPQWGYVAKPNAPQHDVYRWIAGRPTPENGQIKYHDSGEPGAYARDMQKDYRAHRFFIPDDHVDATKQLLAKQANELANRGDTMGAARKWRDYGRVQGLGAPSAQIRLRTQQAARAVASEKHASYVSFGASMAIALGNSIYEMAEGKFSANLAVHDAIRALSVMGAGRVTDFVLARVAQGALRGTFRGHVIVGSAMAIAEIGWLLNEYGLRQALHQARFYEDVGGSVGGLALGTVGFVAGTAVLGPLGGIAVGTVTGTIGYFGGKSAARAMVEVLSPELLITQERQRIANAKALIDRKISELQNLPE